MVNTSDPRKKRAGEKAVQFIEDGMTIGLGSGSTVYWMLKKLEEQVKEGLTIKGIPTSKRTEGWANEFGIPLISFENTQKIDVAIDGADEVSAEFNLIKGGGGSLVREKIVDAFSEKLIIIADESKQVDMLGNFPLPVEVVSFGWEIVAKHYIPNLGGKATLRKRDGKVFVSDNGNYILDCQFGPISDAEKLHDKIKSIIGVVETGLFIDMTDVVIIGSENEVTVSHK